MQKQDQFMQRKTKTIQGYNEKQTHHVDISHPGGISGMTVTTNRKLRRRGTCKKPATTKNRAWGLRGVSGYTSNDNYNKKININGNYMAIYNF